MAVCEQDRTFLSKYDFDAEDKGVPSRAGYIREQLHDRLLRIDGYIEGHPDMQFSSADVSKETGIGITFCESVIKTHPLVEKTRGWHKYRQYHSVAPALLESGGQSESMDTNKAILGAQAREDWWHIITIRRLQLKHKIVRRF